MLRFSRTKTQIGRNGKKFSEKASYPQPGKHRVAGIVSELSDTEKDLLWHMENGYQLETDSLGSDPVLRRLKDDDVVRPPSANRNTIRSMEERGLITERKSRDPLKIVRRVNRNR